MNELYKGRDDILVTEPDKKGQIPALSKDTLDALEELGETLRSLHKRMVSEGYEIVDGNIRMILPQNIHEKV